MYPIRNKDERKVSVWEPFRDLHNMHAEMDRLFSTLWPRNDRDLNNGSLWTPAIDVYEDKEQIVVKAELPGVRKEDVSISLSEDVLTLKGERKYEKEEKKENYYRLEGSYGGFVRTIEIPRPIKADAVRADFKDGVLKIVLPKAEESKTREIKIEVK